MRAPWSRSSDVCGLSFYADLYAFEESGDPILASSKNEKPGWRSEATDLKQFPTYGEKVQL
jgi:hypothetical protein